MAIRNVVVRGLRYGQTGPLASVLKKEEWVQPFDNSGGDVLVKMVASPVHHHDKWVVQGRCGPLTTRTQEGSSKKVGGTEGVGVVQATGAQSGSHVKVGDTVVFNRQDIGTWADHVVVPSEAVDKVPEDLQPEDLALLNVYGAAFRMVNDYGKIKPGDVCWVIGSGAVATATACLLQQKGATVFMILRGGRPSEQAVHDKIRSHLPTTATIKESLLTQAVMHKLTSDISKPKFIFNGSGGRTLRESLRFAAPGCKVITYGNMSRAPLSVSVGRHMFQDISLLNYWHGSWLAASTREERTKMYAQIAEMMRTSAHGNSKGSEHQFAARLFINSERYEFEKYHADALTNATLLFTNRKPVLRFGEEYEWTHSGTWHTEHDYFLPKDLQYVENMSHAYNDRTANEFNARETGGPALQDQVKELWDTDASKDARKTMQDWNMQQDHTEVIEDTYERYLETQAAKYNMDLHIRRPGGSPFKASDSAKCFFPDDDAHIKATLDDR